MWSHRWLDHHENTFFCIIWDDLFTSEVKLKLCLIFQNFQNCRLFELTTNFFTGSYTGRRIYQKDTKIWPNLWPGDVINEVMNMYSYNCSHNLMIHMHRKFNDDIFARCLVIMKNIIISFIKEYRGPTLRPPCDVIDDVIIMKILFLAWFGTIFSYLRSNWSCV